MHSRLQRTTYVVSDVEKSLKFYRDVLGYKVDFIKPYGKGTYPYDIFDLAPEVDLDFYVLGTHEQPKSLGLLGVRNSKPQQAECQRRCCLIINVSDFDGVIEGAHKLGLKLYDEYPLETHDGRQGREQGILDFDGNLTVVYSIT